MELPNIKTDLVAYKALPRKKMRQRFLNNRTEYDFKEDSLTYLRSTSFSTQTFTIPYNSLNLENVTTLDEHGLWWLRHASFACIVLSIAFYVMQIGVPLMWVALAAVCFIMNASITAKYLVVPSAECDILVLRNRHRELILRLMKDYKSNYFRKFVRLLPGLAPAENLERIVWLYENGAMSQNEFDLIRKMLESEIIQAQSPELSEPQFSAPVPENKLN